MANGTLKRYNGVSWDSLFVTPASHAHAISEVVGLQGNLDAKLGDAPSDGKAYARKDSTWVESSAGAHTHNEVDITNLDKYSQSEVDGLLANKANVHSHPYAAAVHNHDADYKDIGYVPSWGEITGKPSLFEPAAHTHVGVYEPVHSHPYVKTDGSSVIVKATSGDALRIEANPTEADVSIHLGLSGESNSYKLKYWGTGAGNTNDFSIESSSATLFRSHQDGIVNFPNGLQKGGANVIVEGDARLSDSRNPLSHTHDDRYYTESELNSLLAGKADNHSHPYASDTHNHDGVYAAVHSHPYALDSHNHNGVYQPVGSYIENSGSWVGIHTDKTRVGGISYGGGEVWFGFAGGKGHVIADGEFYANEGANQLWHNGNKPSMATLGGRTSAEITSEINAILNGAPAALDTLNELAASLNDDPDFAATMTTALAGKATVSHDHSGVYAPVHSHPYRGDTWVPSWGEVTGKPSTFAPSSHTHSEYVKYNPDGDGVVISYSDSNPTINGKYIGGGHLFGADGGDAGYLAAQIMFAKHNAHSVNGYYVGSMDPNAGGTGVKVADGSGKLFYQGNDIDNRYAPVHSHPYAASDHNHSGVYQPVGSYAAAVHSHNDLYYTEAEITSLLSGKADNHSHPYAAVSHGTHVASGMTPDTAIELSSSQDLNDLKTAGFYYQSANADTTGNNYPEGSAGSLLVQKTAGQVSQMYITYNDGDVYTRTYYQSWSAWKHVSKDTNTTYSVGDGGLTEKNFTGTLKTKLDGIATGATNTAAPYYTAAIGTGDGKLTSKNFTQTLYDNIIANNAKVSDVNHNTWRPEYDLTEAKINAALTNVTFFDGGFNLNDYPIFADSAGIFFDGDAFFHEGNRNIGTGQYNFSAGNHTHDGVWELILDRANNASLLATGCVGSTGGSHYCGSAADFAQGDVLMIEVNNSASVAAGYTPKVLMITLGGNDTSPTATTQNHGWVSSDSNYKMKMYSFKVSANGDYLYFDDAYYGYANDTSIASSIITESTFTLYIGRVWRLKQ